jgi:hypothetical protein
MEFFRPTIYKLGLTLLLFFFIPFFNAYTCLDLFRNALIGVPIHTRICGSNEGILTFLPTTSFISYLFLITNNRGTYSVDPYPTALNTYLLFFAAFILFYFVSCLSIHFAAHLKRRKTM